MNERCRDCGECCIETEMPLSKRDIEKIFMHLDKKTNLEDFAIKNKDGNFQLKNNGNYCFFFDKKNKICSIYNFRPLGCQFYPLIYDVEKDECVLDDLCPRKNLFILEGREFQIKCKDLKQFIKNELNISSD
ncbi:MAG: YkgJ family cysteine cluster protein [Candidatus Lokiarchaeota archaeon]|nr:YkgJ family cysteine cluster protein [Candidatus Lokiarchaeota archaeon]